MVAGSGEISLPEPPAPVPDTYELVTACTGSNMLLQQHKLLFKMSVDKTEEFGSILEVGSLPPSLSLSFPTSLSSCGGWTLVVCVEAHDPVV